MRRAFAGALAEGAGCELIEPEARGEFPVRLR